MTKYLLFACAPELRASTSPVGEFDSWEQAMVAWGELSGVQGVGHIAQRSSTDGRVSTFLRLADRSKPAAGGDQDEGSLLL